MAQEINRPGLSEILRRTLGMVGAKAPAPILTPEITPVLVVENDRPEWSYLASEIRWGGVLLSQALVGGNGAFWIFNPTASNALAIVEHFWIKNTGELCLKLVVAQTAIAQAATAQNGMGTMDLRHLVGTAATPLLFRFAATVITPVAIVHHSKINSAAGTGDANMDMIPHGNPVILPPGCAVGVQIEGDGTEEVEAAAQGRVREMQQSEKID